MQFLHLSLEGSVEVRLVDLTEVMEKLKLMTTKGWSIFFVLNFVFTLMKYYKKNNTSLSNKCRQDIEEAGLLRAGNSCYELPAPKIKTSDLSPTGWVELCSRKTVIRPFGSGRVIIETLSHTLE